MLSSRPIPTNKNNPCPICENLTGACRIFADDTVFCHGLADTRKGEKANGYVCVKPSNGHTATFKPDNSQEWTEERRREWEQHKVQRERLAQQQEQQKRKNALSNCDRHKLYSEILDGLPQDEKLIAELQQRDFTPEEIANCGFKSVTRYQQLPREFDKRLPGVTEDGKKLIVSGDGYLCPIRDFDGRIVALQLRLYNPGDGGRYRWVSSSEQTLPSVVLYPELQQLLFEPFQKPIAQCIVVVFWKATRATKKRQYQVNSIPRPCPLSNTQQPMPKPTVPLG